LALCFSYARRFDLTKIQEAENHIAGEGEKGGFWPLALGQTNPKAKASEAIST
jgi:hypothetical protein